MKRRWKLGLLAALLTVFMWQTTVAAAQESIHTYFCYISGSSVVVISAGPVVQGDDGQYYLFELKPYETGVGARTDYCAAVPAAELAQFTTPLQLNTESSKLYSRFVVAVRKGGVYVPISNEMYITNPEVTAAHETGYPIRSKKGLTADWQYASDLKELNAGYAAYELDISRFFTAGGTNYTYNGKTYSFNSSVVTEYDIVCKKLSDTGCNVVMTIKNSYNPATLDLILPAARVPGQNCYAMNVNEKASAEKIEALLSFLAGRYSGGQYGTINSWIIGNEVNNNSPWHYAGPVDGATFAAQYAKEFRLCYNAIKSQNKGARVFINIDQRWTHTDTNVYSYKGRDVLDNFAANISNSGNIDWGLSIHPHPVPLFNCQFWNMPPAYVGLKLISHTDDTKMVNPTNVDVVVNHMKQPALLSPKGTVRHILISEMGFTSSNPQLPTDQNIQAAAMVYAYKLTASMPEIEGVIIHRQIDSAVEVAHDGMAVGIRTSSGTPKVAYKAFQYMDQDNALFSNGLLPYLGATSWTDLGVQ